MFSGHKTKDRGLRERAHVEGEPEAIQQRVSQQHAGHLVCPLAT